MGGAVPMNGMGMQPNMMGGGMNMGMNAGMGGMSRRRRSSDDHHGMAMGGMGMGGGPCPVKQMNKANQLEQMADHLDRQEDQMWAKAQMFRQQAQQAQMMGNMMMYQQYMRKAQMCERKADHIDAKEDALEDKADMLKMSAQMNSGMGGMGMGF